MEPTVTVGEPLKQKSHKVLILSIIIVLLLAGCGVLAYFWKQEVDDHTHTIHQLTAQTEIVNSNAQVIRDAKLEPSFRKLLQDSANRDCNSKSAVVFNTTTSVEKNTDGSAKKYYAVGQAFCNNGGVAEKGAIRFLAAQSKDAITWEFTYGSGSLNPTSLPNYIFDTDPALFNRKYNNPEHF